jgi:DNA polymerase delta subunit 1
VLNKITFQLFDLSYTGVTYNKECPVTIKLFGVTKEENSVCCFITGFIPYFYIFIPNLTDTSFVRLKQQLSVYKEIISIDKSNWKNVKNFYGYNTTNLDLIKISYYNPFKANNVVQFIKKLYPSVMIFESNINFETRFLVDCNISGTDWIEIFLQDCDCIVTNDNFAASQTSCQVELHLDYKRLHPIIGVEDVISNFRVLSFDIECAGRRGIFPQPDIDPVIQIGVVTARQSSKGNLEILDKLVFVLNGCDPIDKTRVVSYTSEKVMLEKFSLFINHFDPDIITGYNINNFDFTYLVNRAETLGCDLSFYHLGRVKNEKIIIKDGMFNSKQGGSRMRKSIVITGRIIFDMFIYIDRIYKNLRSYTLNAVSEHFLKEKKEDVPHNIITELHNGNNQTRQRLAIYCLKDSLLPILLADKLMSFISYISVSKVTGVLISNLLTRGEQFKALSQILKQTKLNNYIIPTLEKSVVAESSGDGENLKAILDELSSDEEYYEANEQKKRKLKIKATTQTANFDGATVLEPRVGYYKQPIATLDFSSLYPTILIAHNICYTTLLPAEYSSDDVEYNTTPNGYKFVCAQTRPGLLGKILTNLIGARNEIKQKLKQEKDPFKRKIYDCLQASVKISANSVYGFTGAATGHLQCFEISSSVTAYGRSMIELTKNTVEKEYPNAQVIYGDTDSVMVDFGVETILEAMNLGKEAAEKISKLFIAPIKLEFEKVFCPYLLESKKRYVGVFYSSSHETYDKIDCKGLEMVRRDNCLLLPETMQKCIDFLMLKKDKDGAVEFVKNVLFKLKSNQIPISKLIISKEYSKLNYKNPQPHIELVKKMKERDEGSAPKLGDRIPYVVTLFDSKLHAGQQIFHRSEDPLYVLQNDIPIDLNYYINNQLQKPLLRLFHPILGDETETILFGHPNKRRKKTDRTLSHNTACLICKQLVKYSNTYDPVYVCMFCKLKNPEYKQIIDNNVDSIVEQFNNLWSTCIECQNNVENSVIQCRNKDCSILYERTKVKRILCKCELQKQNINACKKDIRLLDW